MLSTGNSIGVGMSGNAMQASSSSASGGGPFSSYGDRPQMGLDVEFGSDPASGGFFQTDYKKHDDLKQMLDSNKDGLKLEAMKRIIGMIARGRDASDLFPSVVKNVVSKNIEVKKLVYVYLVRYAEEQQDLVLLSISTFQRALKDPNQLIRASALRVLSSIRVSMIVPIVMLAIRDSATDMSPYVRKTAAHAIPKLYSLDPEQKDELVTVIEKLLSDRTTLVVGSAVMAFDEVCPERVDLIHKNYRKLCNLLVDVDEWGQVIIINMLTRYARTQFVNPNADDAIDHNEHNDHTTANFYEGDSKSECDSDTGSGGSTSVDPKRSSKKKNAKKKRSRSALKPINSPSSSSSSYHVDLDHRMLLRQTKPLFQSRNASVVMAVAQLYHHVAPRNEVQIIAKALIRLLRCHKEIQSVVLTCIASMCTKRKSVFEPYMKSFFVRTSDITHIKLLKLDILTNLATAASISAILREFQTYISSNDRPFVAATIQAIGCCAASIKEVTETCLSGLVHLLSNRDEYVVAESVVVIKKLLQTKAAEHYDIITQMAKLLDFITVPAARASILWLIGEYNEKVPKIAPDVLRKLTKTFCDEEDVVKLQVLNLSVKLYLTNAQQTAAICQYVFTLARYDPNYDIRDRARFLRQFIFPANGKDTVLSKNATKIFLAPKPAPALESKYRDRDHFQLGSLSHYLNMRANGYTDLPDFPVSAPDPTVRNIEPYKEEATAANRTPQKNASTALENISNSKHKNFFSESEKSSESSDSDESSSNSESESENNSESASNTSERKKSALKQNEIDKINDNISPRKTEKPTSESADSASSTSSSDSDSETSASSTDSNEENKRNDSSDIQKKISPVGNSQAPPSKSNLDLLLDLDDIPAIGPVMTPSLGGFLTPGNPMINIGLIPQNVANRIELVGPSFIEYKHKELLNKLSGHGLAVTYRFSRAPHLFLSSMVSIELIFTNQTADEIANIQIGQQKTLPSGMNLNEFAPIPCLQAQQTTTRILGIDFNDSMHAVEFDITSSVGRSRVTIKAPIGELIRSVHIREEFFKEERTKLRGMNEHQAHLNIKSLPIDANALKLKIFECINVACIPSNSEKILHFVGQTMSSKSLVLIDLEIINEISGELRLTVNCEKMVIGSMVLNEIRNSLSMMK